MTCCECVLDPTPPLNPDRARAADFGTPHNLRGRVVRAFFRVLDRLWPVDVPGQFLLDIWADKLATELATDAPLIRYQQMAEPPPPFPRQATDEAAASRPQPMPEERTTAQ